MAGSGADDLPTGRAVTRVRRRLVRSRFLGAPLLCVLPRTSSPGVAPDVVEESLRRRATVRVVPRRGPAGLLHCVVEREAIVVMRGRTLDCGSVGRASGFVTAASGPLVGSGKGKRRLRLLLAVVGQVGDPFCCLDGLGMVGPEDTNEIREELVECV